jgi:hypothetical protein
MQTDESLKTGAYDTSKLIAILDGLIAEAARCYDEIE